MKYTKKRVEKLCKLLSDGVPRTQAVKCIGISYETFSQWCKKKPEFLEAVEKAEAKAVEYYVGIIKKAAVESWQAAAWWLERRMRAEFGRYFKDETSPLEEALLNLFTKVEKDGGETKDGTRDQTGGEGCNSPRP